MKLLLTSVLILKNEFRRLDWIHDYYFVYFLYKPEKIQKYYDYMNSKWGLNVTQLNTYQKPLDFRN